MKDFKSVLALILALSMCTSFSSCAASENIDSTESKPPVVSTANNYSEENDEDASSDVASEKEPEESAEETPKQETNTTVNVSFEQLVTQLPSVWGNGHENAEKILSENLGINVSNGEVSWDAADSNSGAFDDAEVWLRTYSYNLGSDAVNIMGVNCTDIITDVYYPNPNKSANTEEELYNVNFSFETDDEGLVETASYLWQDELTKELGEPQFFKEIGTKGWKDTSGTMITIGNNYGLCFIRFYQPLE